MSGNLFLEFAKLIAECELEASEHIIKCLGLDNSTSKVKVAAEEAFAEDMNTLGITISKTYYVAVDDSVMAAHKKTESFNN